MSPANKAKDVQVFPVAADTRVLRSRTWERLKFEIAGSDVEIRRKFNQLEINIPSHGFKGKEVSNKLFEVATFLMFFNLMLVGIYLKLETISQAIFLPVHIFGSIIIILYWLKYIDENTLSDCFNQVGLVIDKQRFCITNKFLFYEKKVFGNTQDIDKIKLQKEEDGIDPYKRVIFREYLAICTGVKKYKFAPWPTKIEKQQLAKEIYSFLKELNK